MHIEPFHLDLSQIAPNFVTISVSDVMLPGLSIVVINNPLIPRPAFWPIASVFS
jgi:hypothetical protein